jgi:hypothetical protein
MLDGCPMTEDCPGYDRDRQTCLIHPGDCEFSPAEDEAAVPGADASRAGSWCDCDDAPILARGPATFRDHPTECEFPTGICTVRAHRVTVHQKCGRELAVRFCGCVPSGYTFDAERGWWVHYFCGWPTRAWYETAAKPAPDDLLGIRPVTLHEFVSVPRGSKKKPDPLTPERRIQNDALVGNWVRD